MSIQVIQLPYQINILSVKQIDTSVHKLLLNYFPQENESFLHFVWILNLFVFIFVCTNNLNYITMTTKQLQMTNLELIEQWELKQEEEFKNKLEELKLKFNNQ
mgnify:CR=1 FL=1